MPANATTPSVRTATKFMADVLTKRQAEVARRKLSTEELANLLRIKPQTVRAGLCRNGDYLGLKPLKLSSGKLLWDAAQVECLLSGGAL